jgi:hypothetical protein
MYLHTLFLTRGRLESTWTVLKMFGEWGMWCSTVTGHEAIASANVTDWPLRIELETCCTMGWRVNLKGAWNSGWQVQLHA